VSRVSRAAIQGYADAAPVHRDHAGDDDEIVVYEGVHAIDPQLIGRLISGYERHCQD
jgi:hypothetical protein